MSPSIGTLYTTDYQASGKRILAVAALSGLTLDVAKDYVHMETNKTDAFKAKFASGKIPAFEDADGFTLFESKAIARYIAGLNPKAGLLGKSSKEAALIDQWTSYIDAEVFAPLSVSVALLRGSGSIPYNKPIEGFFKDRGLACLDVVEKYLHSNTFLVGHRITLADIHLASILLQGYKTQLDAAYRKAHPNTFRHFETIINQPALKPIFGLPELCEKALTYTPPAKTGKEKEAKPAAPAPKKEEKPKPKPKKEELDDDDDDIPKEEPKPKNPLDNLPKSDFNLEDWKRAFSNLDTRGSGGSLEWFYNKFDKEGFSIWRVDFKYNDELTQTFMSSNQVGGFFNRLEASRKYLFGSVGVLGTANNSIITGVFVCRGPEILPVVEVAPDYESYNYKRVDLSNPADKEFFEGAMAWDLTVDGKKWADGKAFK